MKAWNDTSKRLQNLHFCVNYPYYAILIKEYKNPSNHMEALFLRKVIIASSFFYSHCPSALINTLIYANSFENGKK